MAQNTSSAVMQQRAIVSLAEARALGQRWYFTGKPCAQGHIAKRSVSNRECRACVNAREALRRKTNGMQVREEDRARHARSSERRRAQSKASRERHVDQRRADDRARYRRNPDRYKAAANRWWRLNKGKKNAITARRRLVVKLATPTWLSLEQKQAIRALYLEAASRPGEWHVDHIIPLRGKHVCGLHVPWNLQILPGPENRKKSNNVQ